MPFLPFSPSHCVIPSQSHSLSLTPSRILILVTHLNTPPHPHTHILTHILTLSHSPTHPASSLPHFSAHPHSPSPSLPCHILTHPPHSLTPSLPHSLPPSQDEAARVVMYENQTWLPVASLFGLIGCSIPHSLKADILTTLAAYARSPEIAGSMWHTLENAQVRRYM